MLPQQCFHRVPGAAVPVCAAHQGRHLFAHAGGSRHCVRQQTLVAPAADAHSACNTSSTSFRCTPAWLLDGDMRSYLPAMQACIPASMKAYLTSRLICGHSAPRQGAWQVTSGTIQNSILWGLLQHARLQALLDDVDGRERNASHHLQPHHCVRPQAAWPAALLAPAWDQSDGGLCQRCCWAGHAGCAGT